MKWTLIALLCLGFSLTSHTQTSVDSLSIDSNLVNLIIDFGKTYEGISYKYGGCSSSTGFDCSGFLNYIFKMGGLKLPRSSKEMYSSGEASDLINAKKGDFIFFNTLNRGEVSHVGIVSEVSKEKIVMLHVSSSKGVQEIDVIASNYWYSRFVAVKSLFK